jgi:N-acetyl-anhydromuramyl-L-alanine amidase AmpD
VRQFFYSLKIIDRTAFSPKEKRIKNRDIDTVYALVLHQTGFSRGNNPNRYDRVTAHFVILPDGVILQLHPLRAYLYSSNGFNKGSVAVEFVGNFPSDRGRCWKPEKYGCHKLSKEQIQSGRALIKYLIQKIGLTHVLAHRQSSRTRGNDPGPDIWYHIGQWAVEKLDLKDGGHGFKIQNGKPIPISWRNWGI